MISTGSATEFDELVRRVTERLEPEISQVTVELIRLSAEISSLRRKVDGLPFVDVGRGAARQLVGGDTGTGLAT